LQEAKVIATIEAARIKLENFIELKNLVRMK
jgi:hypothetical protein